MLETAVADVSKGQTDMSHKGDIIAPFSTGGTLMSILTTGLL